MPFPIELIVLLLFVGATIIFFVLGLVCTFLQGKWPWSKTSRKHAKVSARTSTKQSTRESSWTSHEDRVLPSPLPLPAFLISNEADHYPLPNDPYFYDFYGGANDSRRSSATSLATHRLSETILAVGWSPNCSITLDPDFLEDIPEERSNSSTYNPSISSVLINEDYRASIPYFRCQSQLEPVDPEDGGIVNPMYETTEMENARTPSPSRLKPEMDEGKESNAVPDTTQQESSVIKENGVVHETITVTVTDPESHYSTTMF